MSKLDDLQQINTNIPRETLVYEADGLVFKRPGPMAPEPWIWLSKQKHAQGVALKIKELNNPYYFIPQMLEISNDPAFAVEERVSGKPLTSAYFETLGHNHISVIYNGLAHFINDINQSYPILTQSDIFNTETNEEDITPPFNTILDKIKRYISPRELSIVKNAKKWFDDTAQHDASVVFAHGDMNENNIFYNEKTKTLSIIDFADSKYQNIDYMFNTDLAKLGWLDIDRLICEYETLPHKVPVRIKGDEIVKRIRQELQNFKWTSAEFLKNPKSATKIRLMMIAEIIAKLEKLSTPPQGQISDKFANAAKNLENGAKFIARNATRLSQKNKEK